MFDQLKGAAASAATAPGDRMDLYTPAVAATGTVTLNAVVDGNTLTIDDGVNVATVFEFDDDDSVGVGSTAVALGATDAASAVNLLAAINAVDDLDVFAYAGATVTSILLVNELTGEVGNVSLASSGATIVVSGMSGGLDKVDMRMLYEALDNLDVTVNASDINIGNVDVVSMPAITGTVTANPPSYAWTTISGVKDSAGANELVAAPAAGYRHLIKQVQFQIEEAPAAPFQRVLLKSGSTELWRFVGTAIPDGITQEFAMGDEIPCGEAEAISADLAQAKDVGYVLRYRTVAV